MLDILLSRSFSEKRYELVLNDIGARLDRCLAIAQPMNDHTVDAALRSLLGIPLISTEAETDDGLLRVAANDLIDVQATGTSPATRRAWIIKYFDPSGRRGRSRLPQAAGIWKRSVALQRDKERRAATARIQSVPARLSLTVAGRRALGRLIADGFGKSPAAIVSRLLEDQVQRNQKPRKAATAAQSALDLS